jgi:site-specific DNA recombinase
MIASKSLRAVGYARTSGEGQRDNTSIPRQKAAIEDFCSKNECTFMRHYVDESLSGSTTEGREDFQRMLRDAATEQFDLIVCFDVTRFARDGCDIISNTKFLKTNYGIHVVDSKGGFDTRKPRNTLLNFVHAGLAEDEKQRIMERTIGGRIANARNGLRWSGCLPAGRGYKAISKTSGEWFITDEGKKLPALLKRYVNGEPLVALAKEYGFRSERIITRWVREGCLSGIYKAKFDSPEIDINNLEVTVPGVPEVISPELEKRVRNRMEHNRVCNKAGLGKYLLTGFVFCPHCGGSLKSQSENKRYVYYRHYKYKGDIRNCPYHGIRGDLLESGVLDYLYGFFLDEPAYTAAIKAALPTNNDREALEKDIKQAERALGKANYGISNLAKAIAAGGSLLLDKHNELKAEKQSLETRLNELRQTFASMPNPEHIQQEAMSLRLALMEQHTNKDWRKLSYDDIRRFLHFLFGDNPKRNGYGIFVDSTGKNKWRVGFKGCIEFYHHLANGRVISDAAQIYAEGANHRMKTEFRLAVKEAGKERQRAIRESGITICIPEQDNVLP